MCIGPNADDTPSTLTTPNSIAPGWTASADNVGVTGYKIYNATNLCRRTVRAYDYLPAHQAAMVQCAMLTVMTRRLAATTPGRLTSR